jgi:hypothetical protein
MSVCQIQFKLLSSNPFSEIYEVKPEEQLYRILLEQGHADSELTSKLPVKNDGKI